MKYSAATICPIFEQNRIKSVQQHGLIYKTIVFVFVKNNRMALFI